MKNCAQLLLGVNCRRRIIPERRGEFLVKADHARGLCKLSNLGVGCSGLGAVGLAGPEWLRTFEPELSIVCSHRNRSQKDYQRRQRCQSWSDALAWVSQAMAVGSSASRKRVSRVGEPNWPDGKCRGGKQRKDESNDRDLRSSVPRMDQVLTTLLARQEVPQPCALARWPKWPGPTRSGRLSSPLWAGGLSRERSR